MKSTGTLAAALVAAALVATPVLAKKDKEKEAPKAADASATAAGSDVVATIGDEKISKADLDKAAANQLSRLRQQEYDIKENVLEGMIQQKLLEKEAAGRKIGVPELLKAEVEDKITAPTKEEIQQFYDKNKSRMGGRSFEDASADIERALRGQRQNEKRMQFLRSLEDKANVKILLDPPRADIKIASDAQILGPATAPVTLVEYSDFQCPFCKRAHPTVEQLLKDYGDKIRLVYRDYPLAMHQRAFPASIAARCAADQSKYWEYHRNLMEVNGDLSVDDFKKRAGDLGLDVTAFAACLDSKRHDAGVQASFDEGAALGVTGTPAFFINGRMLVGAQPYDAFKQVIEDELSRAGVKSPAAAAAKTAGTN